MNRPTNDKEKKSEQESFNFDSISVNDQNTALNLMVAFLNLAQSRGVYSMNESAKIWECLKMFQRPESELNTSSQKPLDSVPEESSVDMNKDVSEVNETQNASVSEEQNVTLNVEES